MNYKTLKGILDSMDEEQLRQEAVFSDQKSQYQLLGASVKNKNLPNFIIKKVINET